MAGGTALRGSGSLDRKIALRDACATTEGYLPLTRILQQ